MKFRIILLTAMLSVLPLQASYAGNASHPDKTIKGGMENRMNDDINMMGNMHQHMKKMMQQMQDIRNTKDVDKRDRLIEKHMQSMQQGMKVMSESKMGMMMNGEGMQGGKMKSSDIDTGKMMNMSKEPMMQRMKMMENRMSMIQDMMGQMMQSDMERVKTQNMRRHQRK